MIEPLRVLHSLFRSCKPGRLQRGGYYSAFLWLCLTEEERVASFYPGLTQRESGEEESWDGMPSVAALLKAVQDEMSR